MTAWRDEARCRTLAPAERQTTLFGGGSQQRAAARDLCAHCPVRDLCLWTAMTAEAGADDEPPGSEARWFLFGGLTAPQRTRLARGQAVTADYARTRLVQLERAYAMQEAIA